MTKQFPFFAFFLAIAFVASFTSFGNSAPPMEELRTSTAPIGAAAPLRNSASPRTSERASGSGLKSSTSTPTATIAVTTTSLSLEEVIDRLKSLDAGMKSLKCRFTQQISMPQSGLIQEAEGRLYYLKPDRIRLEYTQPRKQITVSDKKHIWIYQQAEQQVIKASWEDWKKSNEQISGLWEFGNYAGLLDKHHVSLGLCEGTILLVLKPKEGPTPYAIKLVLSGDDLFPLESELTVDQMSVKTVLKEVEKGVDLEESLFQFQPPPQATVINFTGPLSQ